MVDFFQRHFEMFGQDRGEKGGREGSVKFSALTKKEKDQGRAGATWVRTDGGGNREPRVQQARQTLEYEVNGRALVCRNSDLRSGDGDGRGKKENIKRDVGSATREKRRSTE